MWSNEQLKRVQGGDSMPMVSFWGTGLGDRGTTATTITAASMISIEQQIKTLVTQTHSCHSTLESGFIHPFRGVETASPFSDTGLDALERLVRSNRLTPQVIKDYTVPLLKERLDLLPGTIKQDDGRSRQKSEELEEIFLQAQSYYDLLAIDVQGGSHHPLTNLILHQSDLIVVCLDQNSHLLTQFFAKQLWHPALDQKPFIIVLGKYDPQLKLSIKNIVRRFQCTVPVYALPYCSAFRNACNEHQVLEYLIRVRNVERSHPSYSFIKHARQLAHGIQQHVGDGQHLNAEKGAS
jgi:MinD-like ATPase involved in chromosome partitioning or flagellar assembly